MWALYDRYHKRYVENRHDESKKWVYETPREQKDSSNTSISSKHLPSKEQQLIYPQPSPQKKKRNSTSSAGNSFSDVNTDQQEDTSSNRESINSGISAGSSSVRINSIDGSPRRHSQTYEQVRDLNTDLYKMAKTTNASPSTQDRRLRYLFDERKKDPLGETSSNIVCIYRHHLSHHQPPPGFGKEEISWHLYENNVQFPHARGYKTRSEMQNALGAKEMDFKGLVPYMTPSDQMNILKAKEKKLLLDRWRETWDSVRPPRPGWHEMKGPGFAEEARRARELLVSPDLQRASQQTRLAILELWRTEVTDRVLFHAPFEDNEEDNVDEEGEVIQLGRRSKLNELRRMEGEALRAPMRRNEGEGAGKVALAPWAASGMKRTTRMF
ncbi:UNVERIFIED_CONTAM: hypothetical protein HDU68_000441 [Siphonaria sp. JEL0065]|nr:hypothetical protein HDU68_000441 [Siphonaria sp. JEL0065]